MKCQNGGSTIKPPREDTYSICGAYRKRFTWKIILYWIPGGLIVAYLWWTVYPGLASGDILLSDFLMLVSLVVGFLVLAKLYGILLRKRARNARIGNWRLYVATAGIFSGMMGGAMILRDVGSSLGWTLMATLILCTISAFLPAKTRGESSETTMEKGGQDAS